MSLPEHHRLVSEVERLRARVSQLEQLAGCDMRIRDDGQTSPSVKEGSGILHAVIESSKDAIFMKDRDGRYVIVNRVAARGIGKPAEQVIGKFDDELLPSAMAKVFAETDREVLSTGESKTYEEVVPIDGELRTFLTTKTPCRDFEGKIIGVVGIARDITLRKKAEHELRAAHEQLQQKVVQRTREVRAANRLLREDDAELERMGKEVRESQERLQVIAEATPVPIAIIRLSDDQIIYANPCLLKYYGGSEDDLIGQESVKLCQNPDDYQELRSLLEQTGSVHDFELCLVRHNTAVRQVRVSVQPITFDGEPAALAGILDITSIKEAEESLRSERRLLRRSLKLHEHEHQLTAYEIHDGIVQDLTAALMFLESSGQEDQQPSGSAKQKLGRGISLIQKSIDEARRMINGLRPPVLEDQGIIAAVENLLNEVETAHGIEIEFKHVFKIDHLDSGIEMAIYRIVQEAVNNIWQHSHSAKACVELIDQFGHISIVVQDWGVGFELAKVKKNSFGLRGIRERAKMLGGTAHFVCTPGKGTRVCVDLPRVSVALVDDDSWSR